jgi:hypothetical protein
VWVFVPGGFVSVVQSTKRKCDVVVRSRDPNHLRAFFKPGAVAVKKTPGRDYEYRVVVKRSTFERALQHRAKDITYPNFKDAATRYPLGERSREDRGFFLDALHNIWWRLRKPGFFYEGVFYEQQ